MSLIIKKPIGTISYMAGIWATPESFTRSWGRMIQYNAEYLCEPGQYIDQLFPDSSYHATARNQLAASFLGDWIWMTDTDHTFDPDIVCRMVALMQTYNIEVLTGVYRYKNFPYLPTLYWYNEGGKGFSVIAELDPNAIVQQIDCAGGGCLLVKRSVFQRIGGELHEQPFDITPPWSEDFSFFYRCRRLGIPVYAAPRIESRHLIPKEITEKDYVKDAVAAVVLEGGQHKAKAALIK
jgi:hypothetical protein